MRIGELSLRTGVGAHQRRGSGRIGLRFELLGFGFLLGERNLRWPAGELVADGLEPLR
jgi:hypothetical protein